MSNAPPSSWVVSRKIPLDPDAAGERSAHYVVTCPVGSAPIVSLSGTRLTRVEAALLQEQLDASWRGLMIPCACGRAYFEHEADSPHGAGADCRAFMAAMPVVATVRT